jgi:pyruvate/2-oxoglutarate dehydrogenase complex dihydrolipoamide acyltransferase (E2) component
MTLLQSISLACTLASATFSAASDIPKTILPDNVMLCQPSAGCTNQTLFGRTYKVITTPRYVVMVSASTEGEYTRADVSIANNTGLPLNLTPDDFRVEVISPKPRVLLYVPPAELKDIPPPPPIPAPQAEEAPKPQGAAPTAEASSASVAPSAATPDIDALYAAAKKKAALREAADKAAAQQNLAAIEIQPNAVTRGRVYFERDKHAHQINIVLPIAGVVFEFPYASKP